jgi:pyruvate dehydrogenase E1 component
MEETVDGEYQNCKAKGGAYTREHFFGKYPETAEMVANMSDDDIWRLNRGGHDPVKVYAALDHAQKTKGRPTVILAKTVKGYGLGDAGEGKNIAHNVKKMGIESIRYFRDRFNIPIPDDQLEDLPFYHPGPDSEEVKYMMSRREALHGSVPQRRQKFTEEMEVPSLKIFDSILQGSNGREISSTMAFVRVLTALLKDKKIGKNIVPIIPDEARTFGMEGLFRQVGIYAHEGQKYIPQDSDQVAYYREDKTGQVLQEGINELGAMSSWVSAATSYSVNDTPMIPFYIYYSMFGFQRIGDMAWAAGDMRARGFLVGGTSGRTTLNGEGLQHQDGHSHVLANTIPNCITYDPTYGYEIAVVVQDGIRRMYGENQEDIFYYLTTMNENYEQPAMPEGAEVGIVKGIYKLETVAGSGKGKVQLMSCGTILEQTRKAAQALAKDFGITADVFSVTSFNELTRDGQAAERWNMLHPTETPKQAYISQVISSDAPAIVATDYMKIYGEQLRAYIPTDYKVLGTDGFGRSDSRENLRHHFEVDAKFIVIAALKSLVDRKELPVDVLAKAIKEYGIDADKINPQYA